MVRNKKKLSQKSFSKRKVVKTTRKIVKAKTPEKFDFFQSIRNFFILLIKAPFVFINIIIKFVTILFIGSIKNLYSFIKMVFSLFANIKEVVFVLIFGFLAGSIGAVVVFSYLDFSSQTRDISKIVTSENETLSDNINAIDKKVELVLEEQENIKENITSLIPLKEQFTGLKDLSDQNNEGISTAAEELRSIIAKTDNLEKSLAKLSNDLELNSKLMLSSSKSELSNRLYLAQSLVGRLKSGVPYAPQLIALGKEGLDPALLRFAKGGAPTLSDLAARLSVRAGELKDADKTKRNKTWRDNFKKEFTKFVKIKPTDINKIEGTPGVLLRAEYAISNGNLDKAINEIDSLPPQYRGVLNAWLSEAIATKNANVAAENLLAKTTAALKKRN